MLVFLTILITLVSILLIASVLIQNSKGGGIDATVGGGAQQMMGAARSTDVVEKATWILVGTLLVLCLFTSSYVDSSNTSATPGTPGAEGTEIPLKSE
jgi:preprotein translocase subunit SecG